MGRPLIFLDKEVIIPLYLSGMNSYAIGQLFGVSWATIIRRLRKWKIPIKLGVHMNVYPAWNKGLTVESDERVRLNSERTSRFSGYSHTEKSRQKMATSHKGKNTWSRGSVKSAETKKRNSIASRKMWEDPKYRIKQIQQMRQRWADIGYASRVRPLIIKGNMQKPTRPEQTLIDIIKKYNLPFKYVGDGSFSICNFSPDFVNCNGAKIVIEVFGDYWHGKRARNWKETELGRVMAFNSFGFGCVVIWEKELKTLPDKIIVKRIKSETRRVSSLHV